jgi:hypothetical protein
VSQSFVADRIISLSHCAWPSLTGIFHNVNRLASLVARRGYALLEKIQASFPALSANGKKIAEYIAADGTTVSCASLRQLAQMIGVSESSIVRFAQDLGYRGDPELRLRLQEEVKESTRKKKRQVVPAAL